MVKNIEIVEKSHSTSGTPDCFVLIIGAMKSGTTSLFEILSQHPQICSSKIKEPDYFTKDRDDKCREDYIALWDWNVKSHVFALESSVAYTKAPYIKDVPERIFRSRLGRYRFIYVLRDPLDRIESQIRHGLFAGWGRSLNIGIPEDAIDFSRYAMQINNYLKYFSREDMILITLEEFQRDPHVVLTRICDFLEINNEFQFSKVEEPRNSGKLFNLSPSMATLTQGSIGRFLARKVLPARIKTWVRNSIAKLSRGKEYNTKLGRWRLNPEERIQTLNTLAEDLRILELDFAVDVRKYWDVPSYILENNNEYEK